MKKARRTRQQGHFPPILATQASIAFLIAAVMGILLSGCSATSAPISTPANRYALVIGVQDYPGTSNDLSYPDDDANDMAVILAAQGWTVSYTLVNSVATYAAIKTDIAALSTDTGATILVYYSGHGSINDSTSTPYIIPYDGLTTSGTGYDLTKWITPATLTGWLGAVPAKNRLLILDSCYSGGFSLSNSSVDTSPADYSKLNGDTSDTGLLAAALSKFSTLVSANLSAYGDSEVLTLAASGSDEYSYDDATHGNGAFTYYLLKAAASADTDSDGYVTVSEAYAYTKAQIKANWDALYGAYDKDFLPHISGGTGDLVLYAGSN